MKKNLLAGIAMVFLTGVALSVAQATTPPAPPSGLALSGTPTASTISLVWTDNSSDEDKFNVYRKLTTDSFWPSMYMAQLSGNTTSYTDSTVMPSTTYDYAVEACLSGVGCSEKTYLIGISSASGGGGLPAAPTGFANGTPTSTTIPLSWNASENATHYYLEREVANSASWGGLPQQTGTSYTDTGLASATTYNYRIEACREGYGCSEYVYLMGVTTVSAPDTTAPTTPTGLVINILTSTQLNLHWAASTDAVGVVGYKIYRNSTYIGSASTVDYLDTTMASGVGYTYAVAAFDAANNISQNATIFVNVPTGGGTTTDTTAPTTPTSLSVTAVSSSQIDLSWTASTDAVGVTGYKIFRGDTYITTVTGTTYSNSGLSPSTTYTYSIKAADAAGNESSFSTSGSATTLASGSGGGGGGADMTAPTAPTGLVATRDDYNEVDLRWTASTDNVGVTNYAIYRSRNAVWTLLGNSSVTTYIDLTVSPSTSYYYTVKAFDAAGNASASTTPPLFLNTPAAPSASTSTFPPSPSISSAYFVANGSYGSSTNIVWNDVSGETSYKVYERVQGSGTASWVLAKIRTSATAFADATYDANTVSVQVRAYSTGTYEYKVTACNSYGCSDSPSVSVVMGGGTTNTTTTTTTTTGDGSSTTTVTTTTTGSVPNAPSYVRLIPPPTRSQISFAWNDNSSNEDKWNIERSLAGANYWFAVTQIAVANTVSYTDATPLLGKYYDYRIQACRSGYGCSSHAYLYKVSTPETADTSTSTSTTSTLGGSASVSVIRGTAYCEGSTGQTPFTLSVSPYGAAFFKVTMFLPMSTNKIVQAGTYPLPNGVYRWEAFPYSGFNLSGKTSEDFTLDQRCANATSTTTTTTSTEQPLTQSFTPYIVLNGDAVMHLPYGGTYSEPGARGYFSLDGAAVTPKILLGGLDARVAGSYTITYQLVNSSGSVVAKMARTVIVDPPLTTSTPPITSTEETPPPTASSVDTITTSEQFANYCDDPKHEIECQSYVNQKVVASVTNSTASTIVEISQEAFNNVPTGEVFQEASLPSTITDAKQLNAVCSQSEYVTTCTEFLVGQGVLTREEAESQIKQVFAQDEEVTKIFTERTGARVFEDSDNDGITNYDEVNIYRTDPKRSDTNNDGVSDGEQLLLGEDPVAEKPAPSMPTSTAPVITVPEKKVVYEDPRFAGNAKKDIFAAPTIKAEPIPVPKETPEATQKAKITLEGRALPNSFVTIYIFSEPIVVTVKTDASGAWTYTLDKELPDGTHEMYSAITDSGGRILAKSEPLPFIKEAAAVSVGSPLLLPQNQEPGFFAGNSLYALIVILIGVIGLAVSIIGFMAGRNKEGGGGLPPAPLAQ